MDTNDTPEDEAAFCVPVPSTLDNYFYDSQTQLTIVDEGDKLAVCSYCIQLRRAFFAISASAVIPMLVFSAVLLLLTMWEADSEAKSVSSTVVEFVFMLLYLQLVVAIFVLIFSFVKRRTPIFICHVWYICFHVSVTVMFIFATSVMSIAHGSVVLTGLLPTGGLGYLYGIYRFFKSDKSYWKSIRRIH